ncbi:MAG TPA: tRNA pseudouridine(55) synthase TruB, partial [Patescibacteria group bacterium]|nr:tRNA pseudouridine(55) synthase TruB [Patescibacteria group bacterium]
MGQNGILLIDKPKGFTSHDVVDRVRRVAGTRAVGHAGTLDPMATGLLILGIGKATKHLSSFAGLDKVYEAELTLGATSDTFDAEGVIIAHSVQNRPDRTQIETALNAFCGSFEQRAPLFSAKKIHGKKLYELARKG